LKSLKILRFESCARGARGSISTSAIHFTISKMVSAVRADATEVPMPKTKSSTTNGLAATGRQSASKKVTKKLQGAKVHQNFFSRKKNFMLHYHQKNMLNPLVKSVFKSVDN